MNDEPIARISVNPPEESKPKAKARPRGLGRGLGALMGETRREEPLVRQAEDPGEEKREGQATLAIADIEPDPKQPRKIFDDHALDELAASIAQRGVIQPVIVRPGEKGKYRLVAGERRWRAAQRARLHEIPAIVRELTDRDVLAIALIENLQREDLNPIEEARAYHRLSEEEEMTQAEIAKMVDKSRSHVANFQRLLSLPESVLELVENGELSMGHARALIGFDGAPELARLAVAQEMSVREVEKAVRRANTGQETAQATKPRKARPVEENADILAMQGHLE
ncbi:MAG: ParB/RepB/Spo0J family partition protein, partial [Sphingomonadaceae bacterium]